MKALVLTILFGLVALTCPLPQVHPSAQGVGVQVEGVYGHVIVYGLYYSDPWTSSTHQITVNNDSGKSISYSYEWNHEVTDFAGQILANDTGWIAAPSLKDGKVAVHSSQRGVNLDNADNINRGFQYRLKTYTSLDVIGININDFPEGYPDGWQESEEITFWHLDL